MTFSGNYYKGHLFIKDNVLYKQMSTIGMIFEII